MKKKNIGAMLSVIAAVTAGASAYATTIDNLDQDQHTNSLISEANYTDTYTNYDLVQELIKIKDLKIIFIKILYGGLDEKEKYRSYAISYSCSNSRC